MQLFAIPASPRRIRRAAFTEPETWVCAYRSCPPVWAACRVPRPGHGWLLCHTSPCRPLYVSCDHSCVRNARNVGAESSSSRRLRVREDPPGRRRGPRTAGPPPVRAWYRRRGLHAVHSGMPNAASHRARHHGQPLLAWRRPRTAPGRGHAARRVGRDDRKAGAHHLHGVRRPRNGAANVSPVGRRPRHCVNGRPNPGELTFAAANAALPNGARRRRPCVTGRRDASEQVPHFCTASRSRRRLGRGWLSLPVTGLRHTLRVARRARVLAHVVRRVPR